MGINRRVLAPVEAKIVWRSEPAKSLTDRVSFSFACVADGLGHASYIFEAEWGAKPAKNSGIFRDLMIVPLVAAIKYANKLSRHR
jgi:hypothetical protein